VSLTEKIAIKIVDNAKLFSNIDDDKEQIILYGAINLFQIIFAILWSIIGGIIFGVAYEAVIFSIVVGVLRKYSGGAHASSSNRCIIIGTGLAVVFGLAIKYILYKVKPLMIILTSIVFMIFAIFIVIKKAPVDSIKKPISNIEVRKQLKNKSIIVIFAFSIIIAFLFFLNKFYSNMYYIKIIESIQVGVIWQVITLTEFGTKILNQIDNILKGIFERR
jgi:accessory gene regulator B